MSGRDKVRDIVKWDANADEIFISVFDKTWKMSAAKWKKIAARRDTFITYLMSLKACRNLLV